MLITTLRIAAALSVLATASPVRNQPVFAFEPEGDKTAVFASGPEGNNNAIVAG